MSADIKWVIDYPAVGKRRVCGYFRGCLGRQHALKHFLNPAEHWGDLAEDPGPTSYRDSLEVSGGYSDELFAELSRDEDRRVMLESAHRNYVQTVGRATTGGKVQSAGIVKYWDQGRALDRIAVASFDGVFAAFNADDLSHMATAFRPNPQGTKGRVSTAQFANEALRRLVRARKGPGRKHRARQGTKMAQSDTTTLAQMVEQALASPPNDINGFIDLALTGEQLRRLPTDDCDENELRARAAIMASYDAFLPAYKGEIPEALDTALQRTLDALARHPSEEEGEHLLTAIEEVFALAAAMTRRDAANRPLLERLGAIAEQCLSELAPELWRLAGPCRDLLYSATPDPDYPQVTAWLEHMASLAPASMAEDLASGLFTPQQREEIISNAVDRLSQKPWLARVVDALRELVLPPIALPAAQESFTSQSELPPRREVVFESDDLAILHSGLQLQLWVPDAHRLEVISARTDGGQTMPVAAVSSNMAEVDLAPLRAQARSRLIIQLSLDGETVTLPAIDTHFI